MRSLRSFRSGRASALRSSSRALPRTLRTAGSSRGAKVTPSSTRIMATKLGTVRDLAPYFLIEPLLPGGTVVALLLWLSQVFIRDGLAGVRQYLHLPRGANTAVTADRVRQVGVRNLCRKSCAVVAAWRNRIVQWCEVSGSEVLMCCADKRNVMW